MSETSVNIKVWVSDDSFEASLSCPVSASREQFERLAQSWIGVLGNAINSAWSERAQESKP